MDTSQLEEIIFTGCGMVGPLTTDFLDFLTEKQTSAKQLKRLEFSCKKIEKLDIDSLSQVWRDQFGTLTFVTVTEDRILLSVD